MNKSPLTAREVAEINPELHGLRQIAFGENYLDDIDAGTGTARFYSGFGMQPDYLNTAAGTEQAVAEAVAAEAEAAAAPVIETGSQDQATGDSTDNTPFEQDLIDEGAGVQIAPGQPVVAPAEIPVTQDEIDRYNLNTQFENYLLDEGGGVQIAPGAPVVAPGEMPLTSSDIEQFNNPALTQESTAEEIAQDFSDRQEAEQAAGRNLVDEAALTGITGALPSIESLEPPAIQESLITPTNILTTLTGGILDIPLNLGITAAQAAMPTQPDLVDPNVNIDEFAPTTPTIAEQIYGDQGETSSDSGFSSSDQGETSSDAGFSDSSDFGGYDSGGYDPAPSPQGDPTDRGGSGGGGGGGKIVCTMMNETYGFGSFRNKIWQKYAKDNLTREHEKGYHKLFLPLVKLSKTNIVIRKILEHIAVHRTIDIRQEARGKTHILGRVYRKVLEPICYLVGKYGKR